MTVSLRSANITANGELIYGHHGKGTAMTKIRDDLSRRDVLKASAGLGLGAAA
ncbi:MAG: twin-arginine translocation signal domain-containing protein [Methylobacteriaceae bacterium]|nr:twin-arginine translocation signal domain-containing protein [Methylobacteriaceae bacterium]MBV9246307.1 twin-arginine translocation signal domain-containing protein [Methylobacteriaceae bacterium]